MKQDTRSRKAHCNCKRKLHQHKPSQPNHMLSSSPLCKDVLNRTPPDAQTPAQPAMLRHMHCLLLAVVCACGCTHTTAKAAASYYTAALDASTDTANTDSGQAPPRSSTRRPLRGRLLWPPVLASPLGASTGELEQQRCTIQNGRASASQLPPRLLPRRQLASTRPTCPARYDAHSY